MYGGGSMVCLVSWWRVYSGARARCISGCDIYRDIAQWFNRVRTERNSVEGEQYNRILGEAVSANVISKYI
jgi:hypothetical protein